MLGITPEKGLGKHRKMLDPGEYQKKGGIPASAEKVESGRVPEMWDPDEYREGNIRVSTEKGRIQASTGSVGSGRVPEMWDLGEYREGNIRVSTGKGRIQASTENVGSGRVP